MGHASPLVPPAPNRELGTWRQSPSTGSTWATTVSRSTSTIAPGRATLEVAGLGPGGPFAPAAIAGSGRGHCRDARLVSCLARAGSPLWSSDGGGLYALGAGRDSGRLVAGRVSGHPRRG